ncbi:hypothetical protein QAD02_022384 [Eretmocerus hayati]|uniref:Uncharacterized protein n=1 Tax=Eretmocerus hayati TaxID=131215 RepID=A0ACC2PSM1_9HYME|nr:hypothetical protein QAD02_022384 [Eretmocerus hayati]
MSGVKDEDDESVSKNGQTKRGGDPGASRHGNFINYYQFHPAEERVRQLPRELLIPNRPGQNFVALDVGCNSGDLTIELHKFLSENLPDRKVSILGIDLDPVLIERAQEKNYHPELVRFECLDFLSDNRESIVADYLSQRQVDRFDLSFCLSVTMWVHANTGDAGLEHLLTELCSMSESVLLEPQPWRCYRAASRRLRRAGQPELDLDRLKHRSDDQLLRFMNSVISDQAGFHRTHTSAENDWGRRLMLFQRSSQWSGQVE